MLQVVQLLAISNFRLLMQCLGPLGVGGLYHGLQRP